MRLGLCRASRSHLFVRILIRLFLGPPVGVVPPAGHPVPFGAGIAPGLVRNRFVVAVPAHPECFGFLPFLLLCSPVDRSTLRALLPVTFVVLTTCERDRFGT